jgi:hypothetical protein
MSWKLGTLVVLLAVASMSLLVGCEAKKAGPPPNATSE